MLLGILAKYWVGINLFILSTVNAVFEGDQCVQGDAHRRDCVVCLCTMSNKWSCKRDICNDCIDGEVKQQNDFNYYCQNGRWTYVPHLQLPKDQVILPFGPCRGEMFKPDWPCNRCECAWGENVWACPLELCREDTMLKSYSPKVRNTRLDKLYEFFKYDGKKEACNSGETREGDECDRCECKDGVWWCKLKQCPEIVEVDSVDAETLPEHLVIELPPGMKSLMEHDNEEGTRVCDPGKRYKKMCNTCSCSSDGMVETCTQYDCSHLQSSEKQLLQDYEGDDYLDEYSGDEYLTNLLDGTENEGYDYGSADYYNYDLPSYSTYDGEMGNNDEYHNTYENGENDRDNDDAYGEDQDYDSYESKEGNYYNPNENDFVGEDENLSQREYNYEEYEYYDNIDQTNIDRRAKLEPNEYDETIDDGVSYTAEEDVDDEDYEYEVFDEEDETDQLINKTGRKKRFKRTIDDSENALEDKTKNLKNLEKSVVDQNEYSRKAGKRRNSEGCLNNRGMGRKKKMSRVRSHRREKRSRVYDEEDSWDMGSAMSRSIDEDDGGQEFHYKERDVENEEERNLDYESKDFDDKRRRVYGASADLYKTGRYSKEINRGTSYDDDDDDDEEGRLEDFERDFKEISRTVFNPERYSYSRQKGVDDIEADLEDEDYISNEEKGYRKKRRNSRKNGRSRYGRRGRKNKRKSSRYRNEDFDGEERSDGNEENKGDNSESIQTQQTTEYDTTESTTSEQERAIEETTHIEETTRIETTTLGNDEHNASLSPA